MIPGKLLYILTYFKKYRQSYNYQNVTKLVISPQMKWHGHIAYLTKGSSSDNLQGVEIFLPNSWSFQPQKLRFFSSKMASWLLFLKTMV